MPVYLVAFSETQSDFSIKKILYFASFTVPVTSSTYKDLQDKKPGVCLYIVELEFEPEDGNVPMEKRHSSFPEFKKIEGAFEGLGCYVKRLTNPKKQAAENVLRKGKIN